MRPSLALLLAGLLIAGCGPDNGNGTDDPDAGNPSGDAGDPGNDGGNTGNDGGDGGGGENDPPFPAEDACHEVSEQASLTKKPIDIIFAIDNSASMSQEIDGVERNINESFANIIEQSGVDYQVILVAKHGTHTGGGDKNICITAPLSPGSTCSPVPPNPTNGPRFFHQNTTTDSYNALLKLVETFPQWQNRLREDSFKVIIVVTDDEMKNKTPNDWEQSLFALGNGAFGTAAERNYVLHSIIAVPSKDPPGQAYGPSEPVQNAMCSTGWNPGPRYEELSKRTGGLRFPVCEHDSYDVVFRAAAQDVIDRAQVACDFTPPPLLPGQSYDQAYVAYAPGDGGDEEFFLQVPDAASCNDKGFTRDASTNEITLCPSTCDKLKADETAHISVRFSCEIQID